jgi:hypothetical protein
LSAPLLCRRKDTISRAANRPRPARADAAETVIETDAVATALRSFIVAAEPARTLSGRLRRAAPNLRRIGIDVDFDRKGHGRERTITVRVVVPGNVGAQPSAQSASSAVRENGPDNKTLGSNGGRTQSAPADATPIPADATVSATVRPKPLKTKVADGADDEDAKIPPLAGG